MVAFSLVTALVLNRKILGRGFFRGVFFYPVLLSPVVVALIWKWILQREGVLNAASSAPAASPVVWLNDASLGVLLERVRQHLGAHGLLHADPARRAAGHSGRPVRGRADGPRVAVAAFLAHHAAAPDAEPARRARPGADPRGAGVRRRSSCSTGGGPGSATTVHRPVHLPDRRSRSRSTSTGLAAAASLVLAVSLLVLTLVQLRISRRAPSRAARGASRCASLARFLSAHARPRSRPTGPTGFPYGYLLARPRAHVRPGRCGSSCPSFKTAAALNEFPPQPLALRPDRRDRRR